MANKLSGWKGRVLSQAGRLIFIKSVMQALPTFCMQTFLLPKSQLLKMDRIYRDFFWGVRNSGDQHYYPKAWDSLCSSRYTSGLGIRRMEDTNKAMITKLVWTVCADSHKTWVQLSLTINTTTRRYWLTMDDKTTGCKSVSNSIVDVKWIPLLSGEYKLNFDVAFSNGKTHTGVVLRDDTGTVLRAWTSQSENPFCAEAEAVSKPSRLLIALI